MVQNVTGWHVRGICPCGWHRHAPHGSLFHLHKDVCPECGTPKENRYTYNWKTARMRKKPAEWNDTAVWWRPWTWFSLEQVSEAQWIVHPDDQSSVESHLEQEALINGS